MTLGPTEKALETIPSKADLEYVSYVGVYYGLKSWNEGVKEKMRASQSEHYCCRPLGIDMPGVSLRG